MSNATIPITIQVFEHQTLRIGDLVHGIVFTKSLWQKLAIYHEQHQGKYYQLLYDGVRFKQYVGVIQIGKCTIEILPKIDRLLEGQANKWQRVLLDMLDTCQFIKLDTQGFGQVQLRSNIILSTYFRLFLIGVKDLINKGIPRQYAPKEGNNKFLKGQLVLSKHLRHNLHQPDRFFVRYQTFQEHHLLTQVIHEALKVIRQLYLPPQLQLLLTQVQIAFPSPPPYQWSPRDFEQLLQNPRYHSYNKIIEIARLILMNFSSDIRYGQHQLLAILFDMNVLFEEYIFQQLKNTTGIPIKISRQRSIPFWQRRSIRPDIIMELKGKKIVLDTKWKVLQSTNPAMEDLKQMYIYCRYFNSTKGVLLFPSASQKIDPPIAIPFLDEASAITCQVQFINVINQEGQLKRNLGQEIFEQI